MGDDITDLSNRHDRLELRVAKLESTVEAQATARAGMDADLSELRIKRNMLQKVLDAQSEHNKRLTDIEGKVNNVEVVLGYVYEGTKQLKVRMNGLDGRMDQLDGRIDGLDGRMGQLDGRMDGLDGRMGQLDGRMDRLDGRIDGLDGRMGQLDGRMDGLENKLTGVEGTLADVKGGVDKILARLGTPPDSGN